MVLPSQARIMPTVVFDHQTFVEQEFGGISRYFCELASRVHGLEGFRAKVVAPLHLNAYLPDCAAPQAAVRLNGAFRGRRQLCQAVNAALAPALTRLSRPSLIHRTYYGPQSRVGDLPVVVSVFDMIHELFPESYAADDAVIRGKRACVEAADHLICISGSTANDLMRLFDVSRSKISVTHLSCSDVFARPAAHGESSPHARPYVLYVGQRDGYKNFGTALRAYAASGALREAFDLVVFGGPKLSPEEHASFSGLSLRPGSVVRIGGSDHDLARAYRHARAFVYPSKYEGFGIPPLEAMSAGCVVAASNASSIPEVVGNAAVTFDPSDIDDTRRALERACLDDTARQQLRTAGAQRVGQFSWDRCARETVAAYRQLVRT
jgi:glycosyltransferase involved in cell wall biosynthesis